MNFTRNSIIAICFIFCYTIIFMRVWNVSAYDSERARNGLMGDGFSDKNTISSAKYFLDSGFTKTCFLPVHEYYPSHEGGSQVYTHYPALPNILAGVYACIFQSVSEQWLRLIPVIISIFFFLLIFYTLRNLLKDDERALIGSVMLWCANYFLYWADNLHQHLYGELLKWLFLLILYHYQENKRKDLWSLLWLSLIMITEVNISFEPPVFLGVLTAGFGLVYQRSIFTKENFILLGALLFGFGLHLFQNAVFLGSWQAAIEDLTKAFTFRATGAETAGYIQEKEFHYYNFPEIMFNWFNAMERYYLLPGWFLLAIILMGFKRVNRDYPKLIQIWYALFAASISWAFVMTQHAYVHGFTNKHFGIWVALSSAMFIPPYIQKLRIDLKGNSLLLKCMHFMLLAYAFVMFASQQVWEIWLKYALLYPKYGR